MDETAESNLLKRLRDVVFDHLEEDGDLNDVYAALLVLVDETRDALLDMTERSRI